MMLMGDGGLLCRERRKKKKVAKSGKFVKAWLGFELWLIVGFVLIGWSV